MTKFMKTFPIFSGDCQAQGYLQPVNYMKYMMEVAIYHIESTTFPTKRLVASDQGWMLYLSHYKFYHYPQKDDLVTFVTYPVSYDRFFANRGIEAYLGNRLLAVANTRWFMYDFKTGKPAPLKEELIQSLGKVESLPKTSWSLKRPRYKGEWDLGFTSKVQIHEIDFNHHANNIYYWNWMVSGLPNLGPMDLPDEIFITYKNQVKFGESYKSYYAQADADKCYYHRILTESGENAAEAISLWK